MKVLFIVKTYHQIYELFNYRNYGVISLAVGN